MRVMPWCVALLLATSLLPLQAEAAKKKAEPQKAEAPAPATPAPADIADAFHEALRTRNREQAASLLAADASLFETGYVEATRDEYVKNHLSDDADFAGVTDYRLIRRSVFEDGQSAWVLTQASIQGIFGDQRVDLEQTETMILRRTKTSWEIVHLHWSAHPRQVNDSEPEAQPVPPSATPEPQPQVELQPQPEPQPQVQIPVPDIQPSTELTAPEPIEAKPEDNKTP